MSSFVVSYYCMVGIVLLAFVAGAFFALRKPRSRKP